MSLVSSRAAVFRLAEQARPQAWARHVIGLFRRLVAVALLGPLLVAGPAAVAAASPQSQGMHSRVRLISGGRQDGRLLAGVEIVLDRGFKTYWRNPGESGLPPRFDWTDSHNAAAIDLLWPAPKRTEDAGGVSYTYADRVVFPILVTPGNPNAPVRLDLTLEYGVCREICIPARAELSLDLADDPLGEGMIRAALARVPKAQALGAPGDLSILAIEPVLPAGDRPQIAVTVRRPEGTAPLLFAEAPAPWFVSTPAASDEIAPGISRIVMTVDERPKEAAGPLRLHLTLVAGERAVESDAEVDLPMSR